MFSMRMSDDEQKGQWLIAQAGLKGSVTFDENSSIEESIDSMIIDWLRRQSGRDGQKTSTVE
jgi:hypothetical protein